jgi:hypothetical protein
VLLVAMVGELFPASLRSTGMSMTAGLATALLGGTAPVIDQILVTRVKLGRRARSLRQPGGMFGTGSPLALA